ncbi:hypothetical protein REPUB_Repub14bG0146700 [Reevesia pubescens]
MEILGASVSKSYKFIGESCCSRVSELTSVSLGILQLGWREKRLSTLSLASSCALIHVLVKSRRFDDALSLMENLMLEKGMTPLEVLDGLVDSFEFCDSCPAVFDALIRACTQYGATEGAYAVIKKLRTEGHFITIHAWNNFLSHLLKLNEIGIFWNMYKEMISYRYIQNVNTFNLVVYALCKECKLLEAISTFYRMLKSGIWPNVVTFNMIIDGACRLGDIGIGVYAGSNQQYRSNAGCRGSLKKLKFVIADS